MVNSKSSIILGLAVTVPLLVVVLSVGLPIWVHNGYCFYQSPLLDYHSTGAWEQARRSRSKEVSYVYDMINAVLSTAVLRISQP